MIEIREATQNDIKDVFDWRNDPNTRMMSRSSGVISWDRHVSWFDKVLNTPTVWLLICQLNDTKQSVGTIRFQISAEKVIISINLAPSSRGFGLSKPCLEAALCYFQRAGSKFDAVYAEIYEENTTSIRAFQSVGFVPIGKRDNLLTLIYEY